ncbi:MAG TPA: hypothetical protein DCM86_01075 [Verrucomicrobiales bacterium]|nr:hypothetical protein [Verrucomicrobiales bacterium]
MLTSKSFLAVDFGAATLKLAEFEVNDAGGLRLRKYGFASLGQDGLQDATRPAILQQKLQAMLSDRQFSANRINVCAPGFHTFSKFVRLPPVDTSKVTQIIQYEAQQNVPFPLEEVVWDYQIIGTTATGELEVLLVAIKNDVVEGLFRVAETAGLRLQLADVSPAALCNSFRYSYGDLEGCSMLLDIGAKTSNLLFFDKGQVYSRGINVGANSITVDFAREAKLSHEEAEALKISEGFVGLGGAYAEPDNPNQAAISKIARQFMTRLHIQVNQTIQFYRSQQGGGAPVRLFLSGGASIMPYTREFFAEKFNIPVEYFNPLLNVEIDPALDLDELAKVAHSLGETVGLGLRNLAHCPVELNLMPESSLARQRFGQKKPYFIASALCLTLIVFAIGFFFDRVASQKGAALENLKAKLQPMEAMKNNLSRAEQDLKKIQGIADAHLAWMEGRNYWPRMIGVLRQAFRETEQQASDILQAPNIEAGLWIERLAPVAPEGFPMEGVASLSPEDAAAAATATRGGGARKGKSSDPGAGSQVSTVLLSCRGVNLNQSVKPSANFELVSALASRLATNSQYFATNTALSGRLEVEDRGTNGAFFFTFELTLRLAKPLDL